MAKQDTSSKPPALRPVAAAARHAFKGLKDWIEVFAAGTRTDSKGREVTFAEGDLDQMVANVAGAGVPHVIGHPKEIDPAYAWSKPGDVKREGASLLVLASDVNPDFEAGVDGGAWRERSVSVYKDPQRGWVLQHIGWLGAVAPAVAGMKALSYSAPPAGAEVFEFASEDMETGWALGDIARLLRSLRDWVISDKGLDVADKVLPDWTVTSVAEAARRITDAALAESADKRGAMPMFNRGATTTARTGETTMTITEADLNKAREEAAAKATADTQAQFAAQGKELAELRAQRQSERIGVQINGWKAAGLLLPAEEPGLAEFMAALEGGQAGEFKFSAADKSEATKTPAQWFAAYVAGRKALKLGSSGMHKGDEPKPAVDTSSYVAIARAANEFVTSEAAAGRVVSVAQAVMHVTTSAAA